MPTERFSLCKKRLLNIFYIIFFVENSGQKEMAHNFWFSYQNPHTGSSSSASKYNFIV